LVSQPAHKIESGEDAGQCDSDLDGIADYKERQNGTNPFDPEDPGMGRGELSVPPSTVFTAYATPEFPDYTKKKQTFTFSNIGTASLNYTVTTDAPWLRILSSTTGSIAPNAVASIEMEASSCSTVGDTPGTITISSEGLPTKTVAATFRCLPRDVNVYIDAANPALFIEGERDETPSGQVYIYNSGKTPGTFEFAEIRNPYFTITPSSGILQPRERLSLTISKKEPCSGNSFDGGILRVDYKTNSEYTRNDVTYSEPYRTADIAVDCHGVALGSSEFINMGDHRVGETVSVPFIFENFGDRVLTFNISGIPNWLTLSPSGGEIAPLGQFTITATASCDARPGKSTSLNLVTNDPYWNNVDGLFGAGIDCQ
jgi:hypothetical protein